MKTICAAAGLAVAALAANGQETVFDGRTLDHWEGDPRYWRVEDGAITGEIPAGQTLDRNQWIFWDGEIGDFELDVEFRLTGGPKANSGIQYRCQQHPDGHASGYQADLDDGATWLGRIYDEHGRALLVERGNRVSIAPDGRRWTDAFAEPKSFQSVFRKEGWNTYRITAAASHVEIWVNGILCSVLDDHQADAAEFAGRLAFQLHSAPGPAKIQFRNIRLTRFGHTEPPPHAELEHSGVDAGSAPRAIAAAGADGTPLNLGFEKGTLEGWTATGDAWDRQPVQGDAVASRRRGNSQHAGNFWLGGYERVGDKGTGTLTSAAFPVSHPWASFLIGGGDDLRQTRVEIVDAASGKVIHAAAGRKRENMERVSVDLTGEIGKQVFVRIVDTAKGGWGHVNYDDFQFHDARPAVANVVVAAADGDRTARLHDSPVLWHLGPNPAKPTAVANAGAQKLVAGMKLTQGFQAELIAAEPDVRQPVAFCMDERGRLWVAEAYSYPTKQPDGKGRDRILIFEDKDGDGTFETRQTFLEGLNLVSGLEIGFGGVWVGAAPQLLFIPRDANDRPGKPEVLLDGWGYQDTHETLNSFIWGPDGWLYGNQGVFTESLIGKPGAPNNKRVPMHSGVWRYHPVRRQFEVFASGGSNQWGLDYNSRGHFFMTHCRSFWGKGGTTNAIRNGHFWNQANSRYAPFISATAPDFAPELQNYLPASARYDSGEGGAGKPGTTAVYGGHSHVGTMIYQGDNWPAIYHDHLFTHNLHGHQLNHQHNVRSGSAYETLHAGYDLLFSDDPQYIPVDLQAGPDGAVYVIDWCDTQHCHNPAEEKWDRSNGRIYRVSWAATYRPRQVDLGKLADLDLAKLQTHPNDWHTRMARRLLQERAATRKIDEAAIDCLRSLAAGGEPAIALKALWALHLIGAVEPAIGPASRHSDEGVRAWAVQLATDQGGRSLLDSSALVAMAKNDSSSMVRLALASALPVLDHATAWDVATALSAHAEDAGDRFLPKMIWFGLAGVISEDFDRGLDLAEAAPMPSLADSIRWYAGTQREGRDRLIGRMPSRPHEAAIRDLRLLAFALKDEASAPMPPAWPARREPLRGTRFRQFVQLWIRLQRFSGTARSWRGCGHCWATHHSLFLSAAARWICSGASEMPRRRQSSPVFSKKMDFGPRSFRCSRARLTRRWRPRSWYALNR